MTEIDYKINGYEFIHANLEDKGPTRGVGLYLKNTLSYTEVKTENIIGLEGSKPKEIVSVEIDLRKNEKMLLTNLYRSPNSDKQENNKVNEYIEKFGHQRYKHLVLLGDFNRKGINWNVLTSSNEDNLKFIEATRDGFLHQHIKSPTRGRGSDEPSLLDLFFTPDEESVENVELDAPLGKSDHSLIKVTYRCEPMPLPPKVVYNYDKANYDTMSTLLDINWNDLFNECNDDIDSMWERFVKEYKAAEEKCVPIKVVKTIRKQSIHLDRNTLSKRKKKYRLWKRYMETKDGSMYKEYCRCRNQIRGLTRLIAKEKEKEIASKVKTNSKLFWKHVNRRTKLRPAIPELFKTSEKNPLQMAKTDSEKAET